MSGGNAGNSLGSKSLAFPFADAAAAACGSLAAGTTPHAVLLNITNEQVEVSDSKVPPQLGAAHRHALS